MDNPWTVAFRGAYQPSYFACHLPGFPVIIRLFSYITFGNYVYADILAIIFSSLLLVYAYRRLLIAYDCVQDPTFSTMMISCFPIRLSIYHSIGASEPLFVAYVCFAFIFYKFDKYLFMIFAVWGGCFTRIEGMAIGATIGFCYLIRFRLVKAIGMFSTFISTAALLLLHHVKFGDYLAYIHFNSGNQKLIRWPPFNEVLYGSRGNNLHQVHSFIDYYFPALIGTLAILPVAAPVSFFSLLYLVYVSFLYHLDLVRYSIPSTIFAFIIGYDSLISNFIGNLSLKILFPFYYLFICTYAAGQIHSNRCGSYFFNMVLNAAKKK